MAITFSSSERPARRRKLRRIALGVLAGVAVTATLTACSSNGAGGTTDTSSAGANAPVDLTVLLPGNSLDFGDIWYALGTGLFTKQGVNVTASVVGPTLTTTLEAGKAVIGCAGTTGALTAAAQGRPMSVVYTESAGISAMALVVANDSGINSVLDLAGKKIATVGANGSSFGAANIYAKYITDNGGKAPTVVPLNDASSLQSALLSGQVDATAINLAVVGSALASGKMKVLANANDPQWHALGGTDTAAVSCFGLPSQLSQNKDAVTRFIAGLRLADKQMQGLQDSDVATAVQGLDAFKNYTPDQVLQLVQSSKPFFTPTEGQITQDVWTHSLANFAEWGLGIDPSDSVFSYDQSVDMSYWQAASSLVGE